jgi:hypothetical protein
MTRTKIYRAPKPVEKCGGKNAYPTRREAETVAREQELLNHDGLKIGVYRCPRCGKWHLTSHVL